MEELEGKMQELNATHLRLQQDNTFLTERIRMQELVVQAMDRQAQRAQLVHTRLPRLPRHPLEETRGAETPGQLDYAVHANFVAKVVAELRPALETCPYLLYGPYLGEQWCCLGALTDQDLMARVRPACQATGRLPDGRLEGDLPAPATAPGCSGHHAVKFATPRLRLSPFAGVSANTLGALGVAAQLAPGNGPLPQPVQLQVPECVVAAPCGPTAASDSTSSCSTLSIITVTTHSSTTSINSIAGIDLGQTTVAAPAPGAIATVQPSMQRSQPEGRPRWPPGGPTNHGEHPGPNASGSLGLLTLSTHVSAGPTEEQRRTLHALVDSAAALVLALRWNRLPRASSGRAAIATPAADAQAAPVVAALNLTGQQRTQAAALLDIALEPKWVAACKDVLAALDGLLAWSLKAGCVAEQVWSKGPEALQAEETIHKTLERMASRNWAAPRLSLEVWLTCCLTPIQLAVYLAHCTPGGLAAADPLAVLHAAAGDQARR